MPWPTQYLCANKPYEQFLHYPNHTCVARCWLDDNALALNELPFLLRCLYHSLCDPILHGSACRHVFNLTNYEIFTNSDCGAYDNLVLPLTKVAAQALAFCDFVKSDEGRVSDSFEGIVEDAPDGRHGGEFTNGTVMVVVRVRGGPAGKITGMGLAWSTRSPTRVSEAPNGARGRI